MREGPWKLVCPQLAQKPKTDADKAVMERYVEVDIQYKYHPDEVTELMSEPDPELIVPPPPSWSCIILTTTRWNRTTWRRPSRSARAGC